MHIKRLTLVQQATLSQNNELPLEPVSCLSPKLFRRTVDNQSILLASGLGDLSKYKSCLCLTKNFPGDY